GGSRASVFIFTAFRGRTIGLHYGIRNRSERDVWFDPSGCSPGTRSLTTMGNGFAELRCRLGDHRWTCAYRVSLSSCQCLPAIRHPGTGRFTRCTDESSVASHTLELGAVGNYLRRLLTDDRLELNGKNAYIYLFISVIVES